VHVAVQQCTAPVTLQRDSRITQQNQAACTAWGAAFLRGRTALTADSGPVTCSTPSLPYTHLAAGDREAEPGQIHARMPQAAPPVPGGRSLCMVVPWRVALARPPLALGRLPRRLCAPPALHFVVCNVCPRSMSQLPFAAPIMALPLHAQDLHAYQAGQFCPMNYGTACKRCSLLCRGPDLGGRDPGSRTPWLRRARRARRWRVGCA